jgi:hypothetical protein
MTIKISQADIKYDLLKIIEPYDGIMTKKDNKRLFDLFNSYLGDLKKDHAIKDYNIYYNTKDTTITYDVGVKLSNDRSPKKVKIHVGLFKYPWIKK